MEIRREDVFGRRSDELNVKVKGQGHQGRKRGFQRLSRNSQNGSATNSHARHVWIVTSFYPYPLFYFLSLHCTHVAFVNCLLLKKLDDDGSSPGRVCRSRSISAACVRFMFGVVRCVR